MVKTLLKDKQLPMLLQDTTLLSTTEEGFGVVTARVARDGIQQYLGYEVDSKRFGFDTIVNVLRPADEVGSPESLATYNHSTITIEHPYQGVSIENWDELTAGECSTDPVIVTEDGTDYVQVTLWIKSKDAIAAIRAGKRELSVGYLCDVEITTGTYTSPNNTMVQYDAIQRNIRVNHVALVDRGRAGSECSIQSDSKTVLDWHLFDQGPADKPEEEEEKDTSTPRKRKSVKKEDTPMTTDTKMKLAIGDTELTLPVTIADEVGKAVDALTAAHDTALKTATEKFDTDLAVKDAELTKAAETITAKDAELKAFTDAKEAAEFTALVDTVTEAGIKLDLDTVKTVKDVKVAVLAHNKSTVDCETATDDTINAVFDVLMVKVETTPVQDSLTGNTLAPVVNDAKDAQINKYINPTRKA